MIRNSSNSSKTGGNTIPQSSPSKRWCFTLNNYTNDEYSSIVSDIKDIGLYVIGKEIGDLKTPHLQGYVNFKKKIRLTGLKKINQRIHWEKCKGSEEQNIVYCKKDGDYTTNFPKSRNERLLERYEDVIWKPFQKSIIDLVAKEPDPRKIHWFWERKGNIGKSFLTKYLVLKFDCIIGSGKKADVFNQILLWLQKNKYKDPKVIILDIPRSGYDYINYGAIESIKNGCFYSGKYEGGQCLFDIPHVICFANEEPCKEMMSMDRWDITEIR